MVLAGSALWVSACGGSAASPGNSTGSSSGSTSCQVSASTTAFDNSSITGGGSALGSSEDLTINATDSTARTDLAAALAGSTPRIIRINGIIDFRTTEGTTSATGCVYNSCSPGNEEYSLDNPPGNSGINQCNGKTAIAISYDTAGTTPLQVGANKTIIGIGKHSGLKGKGLVIKNSASNVIVRNLNITDINDGVIWAGDAIQINNTSKVWIDHNYFARVGRQFIAVGTSAVTNLKISDNQFDGSTVHGHYCDGRHYWNLLVDSTSISATIAHNWFKNSAGRAPQVEIPSGTTYAGPVHIVNNYYSSNSHIATTTSPFVLSILEGNYYSLGSSFTPLSSSVNDLVYAPLSSTVAGTNAACTAALGRNCVANADSGNANTVNFTVSGSTFSHYVAGVSPTTTGLRVTSPTSATEVPAYVQANAGPRDCSGN